MIGYPDPKRAAIVALWIFAAAVVLIVAFDVALWLLHGNEGTISRGVWLLSLDHPGRVMMVFCVICFVAGGLVVHWLGW